MQGAQPDHRVRGGRASTGNLGNAAKFTQDERSRDALAKIHAAIMAVSRERPLTKFEIRIRCLSAPRPWRDLGITSTTWYRRLKRARQAALTAEAA